MPAAGQTGASRLLRAQGHTRVDGPGGRLFSFVFGPRHFFELHCAAKVHAESLKFYVSVWQCII